MGSLFLRYALSFDPRDTSGIVLCVSFGLNEVVGWGKVWERSAFIAGQVSFRFVFCSVLFCSFMFDTSLSSQPMCGTSVTMPSSLVKIRILSNRKSLVVGSFSCITTIE